AQCGIDVRFGQRAAPCQAVENAAEPFGERIEHLVPRPGFVIAGLDPAIHPLREQMDARVKPGHDAVSESPLAPVPNTYGGRGRIALSGGGLRPPGPVGGLYFGSWRERAEPMDAAARSQERRALPDFLLRPRSRLLACPSSVTLDRRTRK